MGELTIITLCQVLSNLTHNRCNLVENSNTCRCIGDIIHPSKFYFRIFIDYYFL
jgi:hypothetical protein